MDTKKAIEISLESWLMENEYNNSLSPNEFDKLMKIVRDMQTTIIKTFKSLNSKFYKLSKFNDIFEYSGYDNKIEIWTSRIEIIGNTPQHQGPCDELFSIANKVDNIIKKKFRLTPHKNKEHVSDYGTHNLIKNNKILLQIEHEGDKCNDMEWRIEIYCNNSEDFDSDKYYTKYKNLLKY